MNPEWALYHAVGRRTPKGAARRLIRHCCYRVMANAFRAALLQIPQITTKLQQILRYLKEGASPCQQKTQRHLPRDWM
jgi:hypothetical protein